MENIPHRTNIPHHTKPSGVGTDVVLADLLDRALHKGLVIWGEVTISVAGVDLVFLGLKVLLGSTDTVERMRKAAVVGVAKP